MVFKKLLEGEAVERGRASTTEGLPGLECCPENRKVLTVPSDQTRRVVRTSRSLMGTRSGAAPGVGWTPPSNLTGQGLRADMPGFKPTAVAGAQAKAGSRGLGFLI